MNNQIAQNILAIEKRVLAACKNAGRSRSEVKLVAVSLGETARRQIGILGKRKSLDAIPKHMGCHLVKVANMKVKLYYLVPSLMTEG